MKNRDFVNFRDSCSQALIGMTLGDLARYRLLIQYRSSTPPRFDVGAKIVEYHLFSSFLVVTIVSLW